MNFGGRRARKAAPFARDHERTKPARRKRLDGANVAPHTAASEEGLLSAAGRPLWASAPMRILHHNKKEAPILDESGKG